MYRRELSYANVWLCMQVIFIHVVSGVINESWTGSPLFAPWRLSTFVVQGFLFLSALRTVYWYRDKKLPYLQYYWSRVTRIIIPYAVITTLFYLFFIRIGWMTFSLKELVGYIVHGDIAAPFYFIVIILQMYLLMPLWQLMVRRIPAPLGVGAALVLTLVYKTFLVPIYETCSLARIIYPGNLLLYYLVFWAAGCYAGQYYEKWTGLLKRKGLTVLMTLLLGMVAALDIHWMRIGGSPHLETLHLVYCLLAIWVLSAVCLIAAECRSRFKSRRKDAGSRRPGPVSWLVSAIDQASFEIYLIHCLILNILTYVVLPDRWIVEPAAQFPYLVVGVYGLSIALSIAWVKGKQRLLSKKS